MENAVSNPLWQILGRCCCNESLRGKLMAWCKKGPAVMTDIPGDLYKELVGQYAPVIGNPYRPPVPYRLNRHEFMEFNATLVSELDSQQLSDAKSLLGTQQVVASIGDQHGLLDHIAKIIKAHFGAEPAVTEVFELFGLCCIDHLYADNLANLSGSATDFEGYLKSWPPYFRFSSAEVAKIRDCFQDPSVRAILGLIDSASWRLRRSSRILACATGMTRTQYYGHAREFEMQNAAQALEIVLEDENCREKVFVELTDPQSPAARHELEKALGNFIRGYIGKEEI